MNEKWNTTFWNGCDITNQKEMLMKQYENNIDMVVNTIHPENLFIIDWERKDQDRMYKELCDFLGIDWENLELNRKMFPNLIHPDNHLLHVYPHHKHDRQDALWLITIISVLASASIYFTWKKKSS